MGGGRLGAAVGANIEVKGCVMGYSGATTRTVQGVIWTGTRCSSGKGTIGDLDPPLR